MKIADEAIVLIGPAIPAEKAETPELKVSAADAPARSQRSSNVEDDASEDGPGFLAEAAKAFRVLAIYLMAGIAGWCLYGFAGPLYQASAELIGSFDAQRTTPATTELVKAIEKVSVELRALQKRIEAIEAARPTGVTSSLEEANRRIDSARAETETTISQLSARIDGLQRELQERGAGANLTPNRAERPVSPQFESPPAAARAGGGHEQRRKRGHKWRGDAFDPALHPTAPGAPRPLGANL